MNNSKKRGFTIVELVIVIAVIAILAGVLIPTFSSVVNKANQANDTVLIKSLNTSLKSAEALNGKAPTMHDALQIVKEDGYDVSKIKSTASGSQIMWDSANNCFVYVKEGVINYIPDSKTVTAQNYQLWTIVESGDLSTEYSNYLADGFTATGTLAITTGLDVGNVEGITAIEYVRTSGSAQEVIIRTNSSATTLTINAATDTVHHYGAIASVNVIACAPSSYHENGQVKGNIVVEQGRVEVAANATVSGAVLVTGNSVKVDVKNDTTKVNVKSSVTLPEGSVSGVEPINATIVTDEATLKAAVASGGTIYLGEDIVYTNTLVAEGVDITLNLNGHNITSTKSNVAFLSIKGQNTMTNVVLEGNGSVTGSAQQGLLKIKNTKSRLTINGGVYENTWTSNGGGYVLHQGYEKNKTGGNVIINNCEMKSYDATLYLGRKGTLEVNGGKFEAKNNFVIGTLGDANYGSNKIIINGGTFNGNIESTGYIACGIYIANNDTLTVNGGTFNITDGVGILVRAGSATIGKGVVVNLLNSGKGITEGMIGDVKTKISPTAVIVVDALEDATPTITNNSVYGVYDSDGNEIK